MVKRKARASVDMQDDLAVAFLQEFGARVSKGGSPSKAELARELIIEGLRMRGYDLDSTKSEWGGWRGTRDAEAVQDTDQVIAR